MSITQLRLDTQALDATLIPSKISTNPLDDFLFPRDVSATRNLILTDDNKLILGNSGNAWLNYDLANTAFYLQSGLGFTQIQANGDFILNTNTGTTWQPSLELLSDGNINLDADVDGSINLKSHGTGSVNVFTKILNQVGDSLSPSYSFTGDDDTGIFNQAANNLGITAGGIEHMRIESDLRVWTGQVPTGGSVDYDFVVGSMRSTRQDETWFGIMNKEVGGYTYFDFDLKAEAGPNPTTTVSMWVGQTGDFGIENYDRSAAEMAFIQDGNHPIYFTTNGSERLRLNSDGVTISNKILNANGSAILPSYTFSVDNITGMYRIASNTIGFATGGLLAVSINSSLQLDLNSHKIINILNPTNPQDAATKDYVDSAVSAEDNWDRDDINGYLYPATLTDKVGIGTATPQELLDVKGAGVSFRGNGDTGGDVYVDLYDDTDAIIGSLYASKSNNRIELRGNGSNTALVSNVTRLNVAAADVAIDNNKKVILGNSDTAYWQYNSVADIVMGSWSAGGDLDFGAAGEVTLYSNTATDGSGSYDPRIALRPNGQIEIRNTGQGSETDRQVLVSIDGGIDSGFHGIQKFNRGSVDNPIYLELGYDADGVSRTGSRIRGSNLTVQSLSPLNLDATSIELILGGGNSNLSYGLVGVNTGLKVTVGSAEFGFGDYGSSNRFSGSDGKYLEFIQNGTGIFIGSTSSDTYFDLDLVNEKATIKSNAGHSIEVNDTNISMKIDETSIATVTSDGLVMSSGTQILADDGSQTAPSIAFSSESGTGFSYQGGNVIAASTGGIYRTYLDSTGLISLVPFRAQDGAAGTPSYTFDSEPSTGLYRSAANQLSISLGGSQKFIIFNEDNLGQIRSVAEGSQTYPVFASNVDIGSGMFFPNTRVAFAVQGDEIFRAETNRLQMATTHTIDMGGNKITSLAPATANGEATNFEQTVVTDGSHPITGDQSFSSTAKITNLLDPTLAQDAATKAYVDNAVAGLSWKQAARAASTADVTIATAPAAIDGVTLVSGNRVLLKDQALPEENGIYIFNGTGNPLTRSLDANTWNEIVALVLYIEEGTLNTGSKWVNINVDGGTLETTPITFTTFAAAAALDGTGTAGYNAYWTATQTLAAEQYVSATRGGLATDASAFTGVVKASAGTFSASLIVNADVHAAAAIAESKLALDFSTSSLNAAINTKVSKAGDTMTGTLNIQHLIPTSNGAYDLGQATPNRMRDIFLNGQVSGGRLRPVSGSAGTVSLAAAGTEDTGLYFTGGTLHYSKAGVDQGEIVTTAVGSVSAGVAGRFAYYPTSGSTVDDTTALTTDGTNVTITNQLNLNTTNKISFEGSGQVYLQSNASNNILIGHTATTGVNVFALGAFGQIDLITQAQGSGFPKLSMSPDGTRGSVLWTTAGAGSVGSRYMGIQFDDDVTNAFHSIQRLARTSIASPYLEFGYDANGSIVTGSRIRGSTLTVESLSPLNLVATLVDIQGADVRVANTKKVIFGNTDAAYFNYSPAHNSLFGNTNGNDFRLAANESIHLYASTNADASGDFVPAIHIIDSGVIHLETNLETPTSYVELETNSGVSAGFHQGTYFNFNNTSVKIGYDANGSIQTGTRIQGDNLTVESLSPLNLVATLVDIQGADVRIDNEKKVILGNNDEAYLSYNDDEGAIIVKSIASGPTEVRSTEGLVLRADLGAGNGNRIELLPTEIVMFTGANGNISLQPNGTGVVNLSSDVKVPTNKKIFLGNSDLAFIQYNDDVGGVIIEREEGNPSLIGSTGPGITIAANTGVDGSGSFYPNMQLEETNPGQGIPFFNAISLSTQGDRIAQFVGHNEDGSSQLTYFSIEHGGVGNLGDIHLRSFGSLVLKTGNQGDVFKISDSTGHIEIRSTSNILNSNGTQALPSYTFGSDTNTGMWLDGPDYIGFAANGNKVIFLNDVDGLVLCENMPFNMSSGSQIWLDQGDATAPGLSTSSGDDTGIFGIGTSIGITNDGSETLRFTPAGIVMAGASTIDMASNKIENLGTPTNANDAATKFYVDAVAAGLDPKKAVRAASTENIDLGTGGLLTIDGVTLVDADRVLVKDQTDPVENGIYTASSGSWTRSEDMDGTPANEVSGGNFTFVKFGGQAGSGWTIIWDGDVVIDTDPVNWTQFSSAGDLVAGDGIEISFPTVSVKLDGDSLSATGAGLKVADSGISYVHTKLVTRETPSGTVDGVNTEFTLAYAAESGTEHVFLNGLLQDDGIPNDYTLSGDTLTFNVAPLTGSKIRVSYWKSDIMAPPEIPEPFSAFFPEPDEATPSGTILFGSPSDGDQIIFTGFPNNGSFTFTKDATTDFNTTFSTIAELANLINNKDDIQATEDGSEVTILVQTKGQPMNSATITGTGSYSALNVTFSGGVSGFLTATNPTSIASGYNDSFIFGFWIELASYPAGIMIKKDNGWAPGDNFLMSVDNSGNLSTHTRVGAAGGQYFPSGMIPLNTPTFVTYWKDATDPDNPVLNMAINGEAPGTFNSFGDAFTAGAGDFVLGTDGPTDSTPGNFLDGRLDEVFFCKNPADIAVAINTINTSVYNSGVGKQYAELTSGEKTALGLSSWWTMDEATGNRVDEHGSVDLTANADITQAAPIVPATPVIPEAFAARNSSLIGNWLDGGDQASLRALQNDEFILAGWVTLKDTTEGYILTKGEDYVTGVSEYSLYVSDTSGVITFLVSTQTGPGGTTVDSTPLTVDVPSFVLAWYDKTAETINIQVDGDTVASNSITRTADPAPAGNFTMFSNDDGLGSIGGNEVLDEWFFCKNPPVMADAITTIQSSIYNNGVGKQYAQITTLEKSDIGLVSWWTMDETDDSTREDSHGSNALTNNGTITQAPAIVPNITPYAASMNGDDANFLSATNPTDLRANDSDTMIFGYWINVNNVNNNGIMWKTDPNPNGYNYYLSLDGGGSPELLFVVDDSGSSTQVNAPSITPNVDHFVLCWIDPATTSVNIQVDGGSVTSTDYSGVAGTMTAGAGDFLVGKSGDNNLVLNGEIDEAFVCKNPGNLATAISTIQSSIYNSGDGKRYKDVTPSEKSDMGLVSWWGMDEDADTTRVDLHGTADLANNGSVSQASPLVS